MTPAARIQAAIECLDAWNGGEPVGRLLINWARAHRYAGSGDRAAVRDHVYSAIRCRRSAGWVGGGEDGRALMIGLLKLQGEDPAVYFTGERYAPDPLRAGENLPRSIAEADRGTRLDLPDWLLAECDRSLPDANRELDCLRSRAAVFLRVNTLKCDLAEAVRSLAADGIAAIPSPLASTALEVTDGARRVQTSRAYAEGLVELQDAASQAVVEALAPLLPEDRLLDYCAGGGGKALAMAALSRGRVFAHDADPNRMKDLPVRAERAGAQIVPVPSARLKDAYDLVLCDAPCSGSGAWRRQPEAKWQLTGDRLDQLNAVQDGILRDAARLVAPGGRLAYATCSILARENEDRVAAFVERDGGWTVVSSKRFYPSSGADGFFLAILKRK